MSQRGNGAPAGCCQQQSPIAIYKSQTLRALPRNILKVHYPRKAVPGEFMDEDGHKNFVLRNGPDDPRPHVLLGGLRADLLKVHVHDASEHDLEGVNLSAEVHFVHRITPAPPGAEGECVSTLIVLGVCAELARSPRKALTEFQQRQQARFFDTWSQGMESLTADERNPPAYSLPLRALLPRAPMPYRLYRYEGSLTAGKTEPYPESVSWVVLADLLKIGSTALGQLKAHACQSSRVVQPVNRRFVLRNFR